MSKMLSLRVIHITQHLIKLLGYEKLCICIHRNSLQRKMRSWLYFHSPSRLSV